MKTLLCRASLCLSLGLSGLFPTTYVVADSERAVDHGPIGVMGDHFHKAGEWMVSARVMRMHMSGNQLGDDELSDSEVIMQPNAPGRMPGVLSVVPQDMDMDMLMLGAMYAPTDGLTFDGHGHGIEQRNDADQLFSAQYDEPGAPKRGGRIFHLKRRHSVNFPQRIVSTAAKREQPHAPHLGARAGHCRCQRSRYGTNPDGDEHDHAAALWHADW